jgi:hypothetical protein
MRYPTPRAVRATVRRLLLRCAGVLVVAVAVAAGLLARALAVCTEPPVDPGWAVAGSSQIPDGAVTVRFSGTTTLLFSDGETGWMTDGWFSRPGPLRLLAGKIAPDIAAIERGLAANEVSSLAAVLPLHSFPHDKAAQHPEIRFETLPRFEEVVLFE